MDKKEKEFASSVFKVCRVLQRVSGSYFREEIDSTTFRLLFMKELFNLVEAFKIKVMGGDNDPRI